MNITIKINTDSEAFEDDAEAEVARILHALTAHMVLEGFGDTTTLLDTRGAIAGSCRCD